MTTNYSVTRDQIIQAALRKLNVADLTDTIDSLTISNASLALNLLIKMWVTDGLKIWTNDTINMPMVANKTMYVLGPGSTTGATNVISNVTSYDKPLKIIQAWVRNNTVTPNIDIPMQILSKQEYNMLGSKFSTGTPNSIFLDVKQTTSNLYLYLTPDTNVATNYSLQFVMQRLISDLNNSTDIPEFPIEWMLPLVWGLADQLAIEYSVPANHRAEVAQKAEMYKERASSWDVESTSTFFTPDMRFGVRAQ